LIWILFVRNYRADLLQFQLRLLRQEQAGRGTPLDGFLAQAIPNAARLTLTRLLLCRAMVNGAIPGSGGSEAESRTLLLIARHTLPFLPFLAPYLVPQAPAARASMLELLGRTLANG
jgi:hypothetical protein